MENDEPLTDWCGTPEFQAREMITRQGYDTKGVWCTHTSTLATHVRCGGGGVCVWAADCWSIGVLHHVLLCGAPPFVDRNRLRLYSKISKCEVDWEYAT